VTAARRQFASDAGNLNAPIPLRSRERLPEAETLLHEQLAEASDRLYEDTSFYPVFPWPDVAAIAGPLVPDDLVMVAARTGGGKSLFLQNLFDALISAGRSGLYVGLEQPPRILRAKWACLRAGVDQRLVLAPRVEERETAARFDAIRRVEEELRWQRDPAVAELAHFAGARVIDAAGLRQWTAWGVDHGCQFVILDHIDRVQHGEGRNPFHEMSQTVRAAKELAVEHHLVMLVATQVGRPGEANEAFMPPALHNLRGGGTKEEEADTVLGIFRPLRPDTTEKDMKRVRTGLVGPETIVEPNQMGVRVLKHRMDGTAVGKVARLHVHHGRIAHLAERDRYATDYESARRL
jgi:replicative DNA helicase